MTLAAALALGTVATVPAHASLVASYQFDDSNNLGLDSSGNGNDLVGYGDVAAGTGYSGGSLSLNGAGYLSTSGGLAPDGTPLGNSAYTIAAWINTTSYYNGGIVGWGAYGSQDAVTALRLYGGGQGIHNYWWGDDVSAFDYSIADGAWHFVVATSDGTSQQLYIDNVLLGNRTADGVHGTTADNFGIGVTCLNTCGYGTDTGFGEFFTGQIDNLQIYDNAFSAQDVSDAFNVPEPGMLGLFGLGAGALGLARRRRAV